MVTSPRERKALKHVLFVSRFARLEDGSRIYRCVYQAKQLENAGLTADVVHYQEVDDAQIARADVVIFARCLWSKQVVDIVEKARARGAFLCGELDDKIFEPWDVSQSGFLRSLRGSARDFAKEADVATSWRETLRLLPLFDAVLVSTDGLKDALQGLGFVGHVSRNAFDTDVCKPIARDRTALKNVLVMSGTSTHDADLRTIAVPLAQFLHENPEISCTFLGPIQLPTVLRGLSNITRIKRVPIAELYPLVATHDLCLVPLEDTVFNDCKSALKFLESGIVSVPVLASPRREFRALIRDDETGFFADGAAAWYEKLCSLRDEPERLRAVAQRAHREVLEQHTIKARGSQLRYLLQHLYEEKQDQVRGAP